MEFGDAAWNGVGTHHATPLQRAVARSAENLGVQHELCDQPLNSPIHVTFVSMGRTSYSEMATKRFVAAIGVWMRKGCR